MEMFSCSNLCTQSGLRLKNKNKSAFPPPLLPLFFFFFSSQYLYNYNSQKAAQHCSFLHQKVIVCLSRTQKKNRKKRTPKNQLRRFFLLFLSEARPKRKRFQIPEHLPSPYNRQRDSYFTFLARKRNIGIQMCRKRCTEFCACKNRLVFNTLLCFVPVKIVQFSSHCCVLCM